MNETLLSDLIESDFPESLKKALILYAEQYPKTPINNNVIDFLKSASVIPDPLAYLRARIYLPNLMRCYNHSFEYQIDSINSSRKTEAKLKKLDALLTDLNIASVQMAGFNHNIPEIIQYVEGEINKLK